MTAFSAHQDTFTRSNLPPKSEQPDFINVDHLNYPEKMNCAAELLDSAIKEGHGHRVFIFGDDRQFTYLEFYQQVNKIAGVLVDDLNLIPGERVLLNSPNNAMMAACWFAIVKAGGVVVATMPLLKGAELAVICDKAEVRLALGQHTVRESLLMAQASCEFLSDILLFGDGELEERMKHQADEFSAVVTGAEDVCLIAFTSGTTGKPKGTMHFHRDVMAICDHFCEKVLQPKPSEIFIGSPPLAFTFGLGGLVFFPMKARASTVLLEKPTPVALAVAIDRFKATTLFTAPTAYRHILTHIDDYSLGSLQKCISAGEYLPLSTYSAWLECTGLSLIDGIGSTEMLHIFLSSRFDDYRPGSTGKPVPGYEVRVIDGQGREAAIGEVGMLAVKGPTGCRYLGDSRQKHYVLDGWNVTGDAYKMDADGYFWFQSRADDMIISSGYNIGGPEVEDALLHHEAVKEVAVVASPNEERGSIVKAFILLVEGYKPQKDLVKELQNHVKDTIAPYKYPRAIEFVSQFPKTATGKIQRGVLRQQELDRYSPVL